MPTLASRAIAAVLSVPINELRRRALARSGWAARGVQIRVAYARGDHKAYAQQVANALKFIGTHDPRRLERIQRDLAAILVWPFVTPGAVAQFHVQERVCALDSEQVKGTATALLALSIVHEATHARLARIPVTWDNLPRIEGICHAQELMFAKRVAGGQALVDYVEAKVGELTAGDFTKEGHAVRGLTALEQEGAPRPVLAILRLMARLAGRLGRVPPPA